MRRHVTGGVVSPVHEAGSSPDLRGHAGELSLLQGAYALQRSDERVMASRRRWTTKAAARDAVYTNRRRIRGGLGRALQRRRSERLERPNAQLYDTGGMRRTHLRGHANILKRLCIHVGGFNLGPFMRTLCDGRHAPQLAGTLDDGLGPRCCGVGARPRPLARPRCACGR